jgi:hypothetical protein
MKRTLFPFIIMLITLSLTPSVFANKSVYEWAFIRLDYARNEKVQQMKRFCDNTHKNAVQVQTDESMLGFFDAYDKCYRLSKKGPLPEDLQRKMKKFTKMIREHYINNYLSFYDILFINNDGEVFYTIRKESDYHKNIFSGELAKSFLSKQLRNNPKEEVFVDFHYYGPSKKPAAFFIEPAYKDAKLIGWFVFQCDINKINSLFAGAEQLGMTQEAFLVNHEGYLLTESNFKDKSDILKMHLDNKNVEAKFHEKEGHKIVTDYRKLSALTSFKVFYFLGTEWLVVVKVDEAQIITEHFQQQSKYYFEKITKNLSTGFTCKPNVSFQKHGKKTIMVDMDEYIKANHGELLQTVGVSTCTALIATYPGKFGYMAHISPYDKMYDERGTNLLGHIIKKIKNYDIYKYERQQVHFIVMANHFNSLRNIIDKLVEEGFLLSQINVMYHPEAKCVNVLFDYSDNLIRTEWLMPEPENKVYQNIQNEDNLGVIVKNLLED